MFRALLCLVCLCWPLAAASGRIYKVLPHYVDQQGRIALSPSLYERDAYQFRLRRYPEQRGGMRFDVHWKAAQARYAELRLRVEAITTTTSPGKPVVLEQPVRAKNGWRRWSQIPLTGVPSPQASEIVAWRVTLWDRDQLLAEQRSFLW